MPSNASNRGLGFQIWEDLKLLLTSILVLCCAPLGLILMWSWGFYSPRARKWFTVFGVLATIIFLLKCADHKNHCGWGRGCGWHHRGCGMHEMSCGGKEDDDEDENEAYEGADQDKDEMSSAKPPASSEKPAAPASK